MSCMQYIAFDFETSGLPVGRRPLTPETIGQYDTASSSGPAWTGPDQPGPTGTARTGLAQTGPARPRPICPAHADRPAWPGPAWPRPAGKINY